MGCGEALGIREVRDGLRGLHGIGLAGTTDVNPVVRIGARVMLAMALATSLVAATREEVAAWYARGGTTAALESAERWAPSDPEYGAARARLLSQPIESADANGMARELEAAVRKGPRRAINWANLGEAYEMAGRAAEAGGAYERALALFPKSPQINWQYANYLVRSGDLASAWGPLRETVLGDERLRAGAFDLAWRAGGADAEVLAMIPARQDVLSDYLDYLVQTGKLDAAGAVWRRLVAAHELIDTDAAFRYFDALLGKHQLDGLLTVWADLERHDSAKFRAEPGSKNLITDGNFERTIPNGGFGWRAVPVEGAKISVDATATQDGTRAIEVEFAGKENVEFGNVVQYVAVQPGTAYRFRALARREGLTTDSGPRIAVYDAYDHDALWAETPNLLGTAGWEEQSLDFRTGPYTRLLVVQILRPASKKLDNQITGTVWFTGFSLIAEH
jgi:tetratricopeptide (TPR) repeat protein